MPTLFISHGAPNLALYDLPARRFFDGLAATLPRPRAILVASAHYVAARPSVTTSVAPPTIHDFGGFEPELYRMRYAAPGDPALARDVLGRVATQLGIAGIADETWGLDHGAWSPLCRIYPSADIPVIELGLTPERGPAYHLALGRTLASLRGDGVLVIGSGSISHNLGRLRPPMESAQAAPWMTEFIEWFAARLAARDIAALVDYRRQAPHAQDNHPSDEHLLPLYVALGAAGDDWCATRIHHSVTYADLAMDAYRFD